MFSTKSRRLPPANECPVSSTVHILPQKILLHIFRNHDDGQHTYFNHNLQILSCCFVPQKQIVRHIPNENNHRPPAEKSRKRFRWPKKTIGTQRLLKYLDRNFSSTSFAFGSLKNSRLNVASRFISNGNNGNCVSVDKQKSQMTLSALFRY